MESSNKIVQGLWIGEQLGLMEQLTLASFVKKGHTFHLYVYNDLKTPLPKGVELKNADAILPKEKVFAYKNKNQYGHGKGSVSGFSDIFRYKLLYEKGNWWVDMDVTCLQPLNFIEPYFFRQHHDLPLVGNVLKAPQGCALMKACFEEASELVTADNKDWHLPIRILVEEVFRLELDHYIQAGYSNEDRWPVVEPYYFRNKEIPSAWKVIHWTNENFRALGISRQWFRYRSTFARLLEEHDLWDGKEGFWKRLDNEAQYWFFHNPVFNGAKLVKRSW